MRFIDKTQCQEPADFQQWKADNAEEIQRKIVDTDLNSNDLWDYGEYKDVVKQQLVQEQFGICCYCGSRIFADHNTAIEHLQPKSDPRYRHLVFDYNNFGASCMGGSKNIVHFLSRNESIEDVTRRFGVSYEHLEDVFINTDFQREKFAREYDLENLEVGNRIIIFKKLPPESQHCDTRKGNNEIEILPTNPNCEELFFYESRTGKIDTNANEVTKNIVKVLGLNDNIYLVRERLRILKQAAVFTRTLVANTANNPDLVRQLLKEKRIRLQTPTNGLLQPYYFVYLATLAT